MNAPQVSRRFSFHRHDNADASEQLFSCLLVGDQLGQQFRQGQLPPADRFFQVMGDRTVRLAPPEEIGQVAEPRQRRVAGQFLGLGRPRRAARLPLAAPFRRGCRGSLRHDAIARHLPDHGQHLLEHLAELAGRRRHVLPPLVLSALGLENGNQLLALGQALLDVLHEGLQKRRGSLADGLRELCIVSFALGDAGLLLLGVGEFVEDLGLLVIEFGKLLALGQGNAQGRMLAGAKQASELVQAGGDSFARRIEAGIEPIPIFFHELPRQPQPVAEAGKP